MHLRSPLAAALLLLLGSGTSAAGQTIRGILLGEETGQPVAMGLVALLDDSARVGSARTDSAGTFLLTAARAGPYRLRAERLGYQTATSPPLTLGKGDTLTVEFLLSTEVVLLEPVVVKGRSRRSHLLAGFYERLGRGSSGAFMTREEIEERHPSSTTDLFWRFPGVRLAPSRRGGGKSILVRGDCVPTVFVDGLRMRLFGGTVDDFIRPEDLEGVELYRSAAEAPAEYGGLRAGCAVILFWTRRDG